MSRSGLKRVVKTVHTKKGVKRQTFWVRAGKTAARGAITAAGAAAGAAAGHALGQKYGLHDRTGRTLAGVKFGGALGSAGGATALGLAGALIGGGMARSVNARNARNGTPKRYNAAHAARAAGYMGAETGTFGGAVLGGLGGGYRAHQQATARAGRMGIVGGLAGGGVGALAGRMIANRFVR